MASSAIEMSCMAVTMITGTSGSSRRNSPSSFSPSISGMTMSLSTRSKVSLRNASSPSLPFEQVVQLKALRLEQRRDDFANRFFVINDQNFFCRHAIVRISCHYKPRHTAAAPLLPYVVTVC